MKKLIGKKEMEDALKRLDKLTQDEARMAAAETLKLTHVLVGNQVRESLRTWVTPPDPSTNHSIACGIQHDGSAQWFFCGGIFSQWKSTSSLLWIYGKRMSFTRFFPIHLRLSADHLLLAGSGKSILWLVVAQHSAPVRSTYDVA